MTEPSPRVAIVGGARTPFAKAGTVFSQHSALTLSTHTINGLLAQLQLDPGAVEALVHGIVVLEPRIPQFAREVAFASQLPAAVRAYTINDNCITGATAVAAVCAEIVGGRIEVGIAGGVESMSNPPLLFNRRASRVFLDATYARSLPARVRQFLKLRPWDFFPNPPGVAEPSTGLSMGEHCELMVKQWRIPRLAQDEIAYLSHSNAHGASEDGRLPAEILPLDGITRDPLIRPTTTPEKLAALNPVFDPTATGTITAGNSSPLTDGAAAALLMSEARALRDGKEILAFVKDYEFVGIDPNDGLLMGPGLAVPRLLQRVGIGLEDIDLIEMHEAFGGQVACNLAAWEQGWKEPAIGRVDRRRLNVSGSSLAVGHPFAATGIRILVTLANEMHRRQVRFGLISICGAGATAAAMLLERP